MSKTKKKKVGAPIGAVNNPKGANQWQDIRAEKPIAVRLLKEQDEAVRARAAAEGKTLTQIMEEAIAVYLVRSAIAPLIVCHEESNKNPQRSD